MFSWIFLEGDTIWSQFHNFEDTTKVQSNSGCNGVICNIDTRLMNIWLSTVGGASFFAKFSCNFTACVHVLSVYWGCIYTKL